jgi:hypothetical protein
LLPKNIKIKVNRTVILSFFVWVSNLVSHTEGGTYAEDVREYGAEEDIWF